ncbi:MAG TPA: DUF4142 domain-containing protein, partial [Bryobacteraceae bacterium]|nr:DUF4142 domain-containing protein [Bryobacteraceae bacterium]
MRTLNFKNTLLAIGLSAAIAHAQTPADKPGAANVPQSTPVQSQTEASTPKTDATTSTNAETDKAKHRKGSMSSTSPTTSPAPDGSRNRLSSDEKSMLMGGDKKFANDVAEGGAMEVHLAQTAQQKSASDAVKEFAKKIEQDHSQANKELTEFAKMRAVDLPAAPEGKHKAAMDKLDALSGEQFDKAYIKMMIRDHKKDIKEFEKYSTTGMDTNLK